MIKQGTPMLIHAEDFHKGSINSICQMSPDAGKTWYFGRGLGHQGWYICHRLRLAWGVFTGKYDALKWGANQ